MNVGIIGVAGYGGGELARLLSRHPNATLAYVSSNAAAGLPIYAPLPGFIGRSDLVCVPFEMSEALEKCDILFAAQEGGWAAEHAAEVLAAGKKLIDVSADFRLRDPAIYRQFYKKEPAAADLQAKAVYGQSELFRDKIAAASLIANPGCYPTSAMLALAPAIREKLIDTKQIVINSMSGVSGAGRSKHNLTYHFPELNESAAAYGIAGAHRHTPEIEQGLSDIAGEPIQVSFTPHLVPITRGISTTMVVPLQGSATEERIREVYDVAYASEPFVHVLSNCQPPGTKHTLATNNVLLYLAVDERLNRLTVVSVLDNLVKGMAGQAVQNMNLMCGFDETAGLDMPGIWP